MQINKFQEYERAVILVSGGAEGPGVFFVIPCLDVYKKIDMRTATYDVPPQEVRNFQCIFDWWKSRKQITSFLDSYKRQRDCICECNYVLQSEGSDKCSDKC